jgi:hypothetical protein
MEAEMKMDPYKIDRNRSLLLPSSEYRMSGQFIAGLAAAILIILGVVWAAQSYTDEPWSITTSSSAPQTEGQGR